MEAAAFANMARENLCAKIAEVARSVSMESRRADAYLVMALAFANIIENDESAMNAEDLAYVSMVDRKADAFNV